MSLDPVRTILIAGGGTAGWMTAAALARFLPAQTRITLVESEAIGTVGVGEATLPTLSDFNTLLGINEDEFLAAVGGTFKLGIEFRDWGAHGDRYLHPFGQFGIDPEGQPFHQHWARCRLAGETRPLEAWSINAMAAQRGAFLRPDTRDPRSPLSQLRHAYHLDAGRYAGLLRRYAEERDVQRCEGLIRQVHREPESGRLTAVSLDGDRRLTADLFIDCTGFRSLLLGDALGVPFIDWTHWLPCDRAVTVASAPDPALPPYTRASAREAGWQWRIPLQHRTGNGLVYSSAHLTGEQAAEQLVGSLGEAACSEPAMLRFRAGLRQDFWSDNCVAIGLSSGFLEPLESTSIHFIQAGISRLLRLFPTRDFNADDRQRYNQQMRSGFRHVRDFILMHYHLNRRDDTPFWQQFQSLTLPDSLQEHLERFRRNGRHIEAPDSLFTTHNWTAVMTGQGCYPEAVDPLVERLPLDDSRALLEDLQAVYQEAARRMPPHRAFIERFCAEQPPNPTRETSAA